jgi:hypothetical protein
MSLSDEFPDFGDCAEMGMNQDERVQPRRPIRPFVSTWISQRVLCDEGRRSQPRWFEADGLVESRWEILAATIDGG